MARESLKTIHRVVHVVDVSADDVQERNGRVRQVTVPVLIQLKR